MAFKPNYNFQKAERDRAKAAKKELKAREKADAKIREEQGEPAEPQPDAPKEDDAAA